MDPNTLFNRIASSPRPQETIDTYRDVITTELVELMNRTSGNADVEGNLMRAITINTWAMHAVNHLNDAMLKAHTLYNRGQLLFFAKRHAEAQKALREAMCLYEQYDTTTDLLDCAFLLLEILEEKEAQDEILSVAKRSMEKAGLFGSAHLTFEHIRGLLGIGQILRRQKERQLARICFDALQRLAEFLCDTEKEAEAFGNLGDICVEEEDLDGALRFYRKALHLDRLHGNIKMEVLGLANLAYVLYLRGDLEGAAHAYNESIQLRDRAKVHDGIEIDLLRYYHICHHLGRYDDAMKLFRRYYQLTAAEQSPLGKTALMFQPKGYPVWFGDRCQPRKGEVFLAGSLGDSDWQKIEPVTKRPGLVKPSESGPLDIKSAPITEVIEFSIVQMQRGNYKESLETLEAAIGRNRKEVESAAFNTLPELPTPPPSPLGPLDPTQIFVDRPTEVLLTYGQRLLEYSSSPYSFKDLDRLRQITEQFGFSQAPENVLLDAQRLLLKAYEKSRHEHDNRAVAAALGLLGKVFSNLGDAETGVVCLIHSVPFVCLVGNAREKANIIGLIGNFCGDQLGQPHRSVSAELVALEWLSSDKLPIDRFKHLHNLGAAYGKVGKLEQAIKAYAEAIDLTHKVDKPFPKIDTLQNIAVTCLYLGRWDDSVLHAREAVELCRDERMSPFKARALVTLGMAYGSRGDIDLARKQYAQALTIAHDLLNPILEELVFQARAKTLAEHGILTEAADDASELIVRARERKTPLNEGRGLSLLGQIRCRQGRWREAIECLEPSIRVLLGASDVMALLTTRYVLSSAYWQMGQLEKARVACLDTIQMLSTIRHDLRSTFHKKTLLEQHIDVFDCHLHAALRLSTNYPERKESLWYETLKVAELSKSRVFVDLIGDAEVGATTEQGIALLIQKQAAEAQMASLSGAYDSGQIPSPGNVAEITEDVTKVQRLLKTVDPDTLMVSSVGAYSFDELVQRLGPTDGFLSYVRTGQQYIVFAGTTAGMVAAPATIEANRIDMASDSVLQAIGVVESLNGRGDAPPRIRSIEPESKEVSVRILAEAFDDIIPRQLIEGLCKTGTTRLIVVPDGRLVGIPFHVLFDTDTNSYMLDRFLSGIVYVPSLTSYALVKDRADTRTYDTCVVFANANADDPALSSLPGIKVEIEQLDSLFSRCTYFVNEDATVEAFVDTARSATVVYFAGHGKLKREDALGGGLILSNGVLSARDLLRRHVTFTKARLVILSCCHLGTASPDGREVVGFIRAMFHAGAPTVVAGMWSICDEVAAELMPTFCKNVIERNMDCAEALRAAILHVRDDSKSRSEISDWDHPAYWGPFAIWGTY